LCLKTKCHSVKKTHRHYEERYDEVISIIKKIATSDSYRDSSSNDDYYRLYIYILQSNDIEFKNRILTVDIQ